MTGLSFTSYTTDDKLYKQACVLRKQILRLPLGLKLRKQDVAQDGCSNMRHFAAVHQGCCVGSVSLYVEGKAAELRQMCIDGNTRGQGVGEQLVLYAEQAMIDQGVVRVCMHARVSAQRFYQRLGYAVTSESHDHLGVEHVWMSRFISK